MNIPSLPSLSLLVPVLLLAIAGPAWAYPNEDSLVCARVKDAYATDHFRAAIWPRSAEYGSMDWCEIQVKAVEHCVPVEAVVEDTNAPYEGFRGPELVTEYTCYKVRCANGEALRFLGAEATVSDTFGDRAAASPKVARVCVPNR